MTPLALWMDFLADVAVVAAGIPVAVVGWIVMFVLLDLIIPTLKD